MDDVVPELLEEDRGVGRERLRGRRHRLELVVLDLDEFAAVFGQVAGLGDDERDRVADEPDLVARQCLVHGRPVAFDLEVEVERLREALQIGCRVDGNDPGKGPCRTRVDPDDVRRGRAGYGESWRAASRGASTSST